ncbi:fungal-specific transcription factor domain-containing protein, partial [Dactylonectria estremocensis]
MSETTSATDFMPINPPRERAAKRRKIALACNYCRARKTRCDGKQPACSTCETKGWSDSCVYEQGALKTQRYVSNLEARLEEYERRAETGESSSIIEANARGEMATVSGSRIATLSTGVGRDDENAARQASDTWTRSESSPTQARYQAPPMSRRATDGMPTPPHHDLISTDAMVVVPSPGDASDFPIGESSPIAFARSMLRTVGKNNTPFRVCTAAFGNPVPSFVASNQQDLDVEALFLPPRRVADGFVESFWEFLHPILPILHKPTFTKSYNMLWVTGKELDSDPDTLQDSVFFSTLNIVLAIGCQFSDQVVASRKLAIADKLYQRSKRFFVDEFLDSPTLSVVQLLLLTGVCLQSTKYANRCWSVIGSAIRTAQSIGLHLERRSGSRNQLQREMERRVWHTCVFLDRQFAVTFGRPTMISAQSKVPMPLMIDDEYLVEDGEGSQPSHLNSQLSSFVYSNKLFDILNDILVAFYMKKNTIFQKSDTHSCDCDELNTILKFNRALYEFRDSLPSYLAIPQQSESPRDPKIELGARILYSRLLYIHIFLLRPILLSVTQASNDTQSLDDDRLEHQLALKACRLCISRAQTLIAHMYENMDSSYWTSISHKIHYAFSCAVVLIAARLCPMPEVDISSTSLQASWSQCIELFEYYEPHFPSASHVLQILEMLEDRLQAEDYAPPDVNEDISADTQRLLDSALSLGHLEGLGLDSNWIMLDDLLQGDWLSKCVAEETSLGETMFGVGWEELI